MFHFIISTYFRSFGYELWRTKCCKTCRFHIMCYFLTGLQLTNPIGFPMQNSMFFLFEFTCFWYGLVCLNKGNEKISIHSSFQICNLSTVWGCNRAQPKIMGANVLLAFLNVRVGQNERVQALILFSYLTKYTQSNKIQNDNAIYPSKWFWFTFHFVLHKYCFHILKLESFCNCFWSIHHGNINVLYTGKD